MGLENTIRTQLETYLTMMVDPIEIHAQLDETDKSKEMMDLLRELSEINAKISLKEVQDNDMRVPSFGLSRQGEVPRVHFAGIPMGHEFTSLVLALLHVSGHAPKIEAATAEQIKRISGTYRFESFISLSCHNCPDVVQALNILAVLNPGFSHTMVDGSIFHEEASRRQVMAVPSIFLNDEMFGSGRMQIEEILAKLDTTASIDLAHTLSEKEPFDVLVIGGGPSGASAAIYAARKGIRTGIVTEKFGGQVSETLGIENFISVSATEGPRLVASMEEHVKEYGVDIMRTQRAVSLEKEGDYFRVGLQNGASLKSKTMILSTGARWRELGVPGESEFKGKGVAYCPHCDGPVFKGKRIAVIGGGNSGVEAAIDLAGIVEHVTLLEFAPELKADAVLQNRLRSLQNVDILVHVQTSEVTGTDKVNGLSYVDRSTLEKHHIPLAGVFVQIGLMPNTDWLKGTLELNRFGEIVVNAHGATSMTGVFAAGDCTTVPFKQIIIAMGEGAKAALGAFDYLIRNT